MFRNLWCLLSVAIALAACTSTAPPVGAHPGATLGRADPVKVEIRPDYRLNPGDVIQVEVFNQPTLNQTVQLDSTGAIALTLLGRVSAAGKTAFELSQQVRDGYADKYLQNPQVAVLIKQQRVDTITVD